MADNENEDEINPVFFEQVLIKLLFTNEDVRDRIIPYLTTNVFDDVPNINIVKKILEFHEEYNKMPSIQEMKLILNNQDYYTRLKDIMVVDLTDYTEDFILGMIEVWFRGKKVNEVNTEITQNLIGGELDKVGECVDKLREATSFSFSNEVGIDVFESEEEIYNYLHDKSKTISSGIVALDDCIEGGFHEKSLTLFMAEVNLGKSLILSSLACSNVLQNKNVLYITCEMSRNKIAERVLANIFDTEIMNLKKLSKKEFHNYFEDTKKILKSKLYVEEYPPNSINANNIRNLLKELKVKRKFVPDIIYVDYLEIMSPIHRYKADSSYLIVKRISEEVRAISMEIGTPFVSAVQCNREGFGSIELDLTNISQSIGTAATADIIVGVTQTEELRAQKKYNWMILKNRYGINKRKMSIDVDYYKMRVFESDIEGNPVGDMSRIINPTPSSEKKSDSRIDDAISDINMFLDNDLTKVKEGFDFE